MQRWLAVSDQPLRLLTYSSLFPSAALPRHGIFVAERLRQQAATGRLVSQVVSPVPWFPFRHPRFGRYADFARIPDADTVSGFQVAYPRYPAIPKLGMSLAPLLMERGSRASVSRSIAGIELVDAHFLYPDGVAAVILGRRLNVPVVLTARGSDINQFSEFAIPRRWLVWAMCSAAHVFTVSSALRQRVLELGVPEGQVTVSRNGIDLERFQLQDKLAARRRLGWPEDARIMISVGNLLELKGHHVLIDAMRSLADTKLMIVGEGPERTNLEAQIAAHDLGDRISLLGLLEQAQLPDIYAAADICLLASSREGLPNVILESIACGTPVVATAVGGVPEVINAAAAGRLVAERSARAFVDAIQALSAAKPERTATRRHAERFAWSESIGPQIDMMLRIVRDRPVHESRGVEDAR